MSLKALIVDDESKLREVLRIKLSRHCPLVEILGEAGDIDAAEKLITSLQPNLVFLDISMPGGSGFELLDRFETIPFQIIFVTGYSEYAIQALKLSAVDYLLKPIVTDSLIESVHRANQRLAQNHAMRNKILQENSTADTKKVAIPVQSGYDFVETSNIIRLEGWDKYTRIHVTDGQQIVSSYNIGVYREMLEPFNFIDIHKSHIVNQAHVKAYDKAGEVILSDGSRAPVSRRKREDFLQRMVDSEN